MSAIEIHNIVETAWPNEAGTVRSIQKMVKSFKDGERTSFDRIEGQGKPTSTLRRESVELINDAINEDNRISERRLSKRFNIEKTMIHRILNEELQLTWMKSKWVPHILDERKYQVRVECCENMLQALKSRIAQRNLVVVDEKYFLWALRYWIVDCPWW